MGRQISRRNRIVMACTAVVAVAGVVAVVLPAAAATAGAITGYGSKCIDIASASTANGAAIQLYTCNGTNAQQWTVADDGSIQALGKCMDVTAAGTANGTQIQLYDCNATAAQKWSYNSSQQLVNPVSGKCLDATGPSSADGTRLQIWTCGTGANQKWTLPGGTVPPTATPTVSPTVSPTQPPSGGAFLGAGPYLYLGWGSPPSPTTVMSATGVKAFTMAFMLTNGTCNPAWDGYRALTGGQDQTTINAIRAAGGEVVISFGGASGTKLERSCTSVSALTGAYQKVINAYSLKGIDIDIEESEYADATIQQRTIDALKAIKAANPGLVVYVTFPSGTTGPDSSMINRAAASGLTVDGWTIMPFDFPAAGQNMATLTTQATDGLKNRLKTAYGYSDDVAYRHSGISSMNGITDVNEIVTLANYQTMLAYAKLHHLARFTFWSANRDRPCPGGYPNDDTCSGVSQSAWDFTRVTAQYTG